MPNLQCQGLTKRIATQALNMRQPAADFGNSVYGFGRKAVARLNSAETQRINMIDDTSVSPHGTSYRLKYPIKDLMQSFCLDINIC